MAASNPVLEVGMVRDRDLPILTLYRVDHEHSHGQGWRVGTMGTWTTSNVCGNRLNAIETLYIGPRLPHGVLRRANRTAGDLAHRLCVQSGSR